MRTRVLFTRSLAQSALGVILCALASSSAWATTNRTQKANAEKESAGGKLFVLVVVDQMRSDYVERFAPVWDAARQQSQGEGRGQSQNETRSEGGFQWFLNSGANFANARTASAPTVTAAGHAALCTGNSALANGIAFNEYFDRTLGRSVPVVHDPKATLVRTPGLLGKGLLETAPSEGVSAIKLRAEPLGDRLKRAAQAKKIPGPPGKSVAISLKDRAALVCGGRSSDGAYFFDDRSGSMVTSSASGTPLVTALPGWVDEFNRRRRPEKSSDWTLRLNDRAVYASVIGAAALDANSKIAMGMKGRDVSLPMGEFPFRLAPTPKTSNLEVYQRFQLTPAASDYLVDFAIEAVEKERLGQSGAADVLVLSFSTPDLVGHRYGPSSLELLDTYAWLDRSLERLYAGIEKSVKVKGGSRTQIVWALSSDHGVQQLPEITATNKPGALRIDGKALVQQLNGEISALAGWGGGDWIKSIVSDQLIFNEELLKTKGKTSESLTTEVLSRAQKQPGVALALSRADVARAAGVLEGKKGASETLARARKQDLKTYALEFLARGFDAATAGDVYLVYTEGSFLGGKSLATHGSVWDADARIPMFIAAPGRVVAQRIEEEVFADDLVPTLLDVAFGGASSKESSFGSFTGVARPVRVQAESQAR